jgi:hypothetical protein
VWGFLFTESESATFTNLDVIWDVPDIDNEILIKAEGTITVEISDSTIDCNLSRPDSESDEI